MRMQFLMGGMILKIWGATLLPLIVLGGAIFLLAAIYGIILGLIRRARTNVYVKKYVQQGPILPNQRKELFDILLQKGEALLESRCAAQAIPYLNDCLALEKIDNCPEKKESAAVTLAKCYMSMGKYKEALKILHGVDVSGRAHLLFSEICLITGDRERAAIHANLVVKSSNYSEEFQEQGRILLQNAEAMSADQELQNSRARFEAAIASCKQLKDNKPLSYYLRLYTDITGFITEEQHSTYRQQLSELAFRVAQGCCEYHMLNHAYTYLLKADSVTSPEKDLMYAMVYARMGPHHRYLYDSKTTYYLEQGRKQYQGKLESVEMPPLNYRKALEYAERARSNGIENAQELCSQITDALETQQKEANRRELAERIQAVWDREYMKKYGMTHSEYWSDQYEEAEAQLAATQQWQQEEAASAADHTRRQQRLERDREFSEMLHDKIHGGTGKSMKEKWETGEITNEEYQEYLHKHGRNSF